jgi:hypothetical protein
MDSKAHRFGLRDVWLLSQLQDAGVALDIEGSIIWPQSPLAAALAGRMPFDTIHADTYVLNTHNGTHRMRGFVQARLRPNGIESDVVFIAPALDGDEVTEHTWQQLLTDLVKAEGARGRQRLFAKVPEEQEGAVEGFRSVGFGVYTQEFVYQRPALLKWPRDEREVTLRPLRDKDAWGLHRLYTNAAPRLVQQTEALPEESWESTPISRLQGVHDDAYVWERDDEILGYLRIVDGRKGYWLKALLHHDAQGYAENLFRAGLAKIDRAEAPIYCTVRGYEAGLRWALKHLGFEPVATLFLLVKHTTVFAQQPEPKRVPIPERAVEAAPSASRSSQV